MSNKDNTNILKTLTAYSWKLNKLKVFVEISMIT